MEKYKKCLIYFDTNMFECRHSGKELFLNTIRASELFYNIRDAIIQLGLSEQVKLCVPEIVLYEMKQHMKEKFKAAIDSFRNKVTEIKKSFGDLIDIQYELKGIETDSNYASYVDSLFLEFLHNPRNMLNIVDYPREDVIFNSIINKAVEGFPPFHKAKSNRKEYTDAGLKDALIWETVKKHGNDELVIFITNDCDFDQIRESDVCVCTNLSEVKTKLIEVMEIAPEKLFMNRLLDNDKYLLKQIIEESELYGCFEKAPQVEKIHKSQIETDELGRQSLHVICDIDIDDTVYEFTIKYDLNVNELISVEIKG